MFQEGFGVCLIGLAAGVAFLIVLVILVKLISLIFAAAAGGSGEMEVPPGFFSETVETPVFRAAAAAGTAGSDANFKSIAIAIAAVKARSDKDME